MSSELKWPQLLVKSAEICELAQDIYRRKRRAQGRETEFLKEPPHVRQFYIERAQADIDSRDPAERVANVVPFQQKGTHQSKRMDSPMSESPTPLLERLIAEFIDAAERYHIHLELLFDEPVEITVQMLKARDRLRAALAVSANATLQPDDLALAAQLVRAVCGPTPDPYEWDIVSERSMSSKHVGSPPQPTAVSAEPPREQTDRCERCQMELPVRLLTFGVGVRGGDAAWCAACRPQPGQEGEAKRAEVIALRRAARAGSPDPPTPEKDAPRG